MTFDACVREIEGLSGTLVQVEIWGPAENSVTVASFSGELSRMGEIELPPAFPRDAVVETAVTFIVGDATLGLWPSRFVGGRAVPDRRDWLEIRSEDAVVQIGPKRPAWFD